MTAADGRRSLGALPRAVTGVKCLGQRLPSPRQVTAA